MFFRIFLQKKRIRTEQHEDEFERYLKYVETAEEGDDPIEWWKRHEFEYPCLTKMAMDYLCIPATSVPSEQLFSKAGETISDRRNRLHSQTAKMLLSLEDWNSPNGLLPFSSQSIF